MGRHKQSTKTKIVKAAWKLFYKQGYDNTTVDDIIEASQTSKGTFYHYFKGKDGLLTSLSFLFDEKYEELYEIMPSNLSCYDKLYFLNKELFSMIQETIDVNLLASLYSSHLTTKDERYLLNPDRFYITLITKLIAEGILSGEFSPTRSVDDLVKIYTATERGLLYDWALCKGDYDVTKYSSDLISAVLTSFLDK